MVCLNVRFFHNLGLLFGGGVVGFNCTEHMLIWKITVKGETRKAKEDCDRIGNNDIIPKIEQRLGLGRSAF